MTWFAFRCDDSAKERDLEVGLKKFLVGTLLLGARLTLAYGDRSVCPVLFLICPVLFLTCPLYTCTQPHLISPRKVLLASLDT